MLKSGASTRKWQVNVAGLAVAAFAIALGARLLNAGAVHISPVDELYHWKRIAYSAQHFPQVLEFDPDRGVGGAFCPWPPLYDLMAGGAARLLGARNDAAVLARVIWFPPLLFAAFVAVAVFVLSRAFGAIVAIIAGIALATSPFLVTASWIGSIDHHFLEPPLAFAILGASLLAIRQSPFAALALAAAITSAMFVQTALVIAAALAFVVLFLWTDGRAGAIGFATAAIAIAVYRLTRTPGYPDNAWFLGWTHVALFAAGAVALWGATVGRRSALILSALIVLPFAPRLLEGATFLGGDPWLRTILEFQPLWRARGEDLLSIAVGLGGGAILVWLLVMGRDRVESTVALFAIVYLALTISSRRFWIVAIPMLAVAGALYARRRPALAFLLVALPPPLQLAGWMLTPFPVPPNQQAWVRAARFLQGQPPGRVLGPWSMGHAIDVLGRHAVVIDNFGTMPDATLFHEANEQLRGHDEAALSRWCNAHGVRYVILDDRPAKFRLIWSEPTLRIYEPVILSRPERSEGTAKDLKMPDSRQLEVLRRRSLP